MSTKNKSECVICHKVAKIPMRRCIGCMTSFPQNELIRVTLYQGKLSVDKGGSAPGRGAYLCDNDECIEKARKSRAFSRAFHRKFDREETDRILDEIRK